MKNNICTWFEIPVKDMNRAVLFYENILDIKMTKMEKNNDPNVEMYFFPGPEGDVYGAMGGLVKAKGMEPGNHGPVVYLYTDDMEKTLEKIASEGCKVVMPKKDIGEYGYIAHFMDSEGNFVALHKSKD